MAREETNLALGHAGLEQLVVDQHAGVADVEVGGHTPHVGDVQIAAALMEARLYMRNREVRCCMRDLVGACELGKGQKDKSEVSGLFTHPGMHTTERLD